MKKILLIISCFCLLLIYSCQDEFGPELGVEDTTPKDDPTHNHRTCSMNSHMEKLLADPDYRKKHESKLVKVQQIALERGPCNTPTVLPIAVHFQGVPNPNGSCLVSLAQTQIQVLNDDFRGLNADITNWTNNAASYFPGVSNGDACVDFCLASANHPSGYGLVDGEPAVTINQTSGDFDANWSGYINIFVQFNTGLLGYSPLGGQGNGDGVVIDANAFGTGSGCGAVVPNSPYDLGRTLTHELGHYLFLDHVWGNNGGCNQDDQVGDTPNTKDPYYGCPQIGESSCSSTDMHMNYMDYVDDACMYMLTEGQSDRVISYYTSSLQNVISNASSVCGGGGGNTPTCTDGIQNGQETGVDCGGPTCPPCQAEGCEAPTGISISNITANAADVSFNPVSNAVKYQIRYRIPGQTWSKVTITNTSYTLQGLQANTTYQVRVRTRCDSEWSKQSPIETFTTTGTGNGGGNGCQDYELFFSLTFDQFPEETSWELFTWEGQTIDSGSGYDNQEEGSTIEESFCLEDGCYSFEIYDTYGDGICCFYGNGSWDLMDDQGYVIESDGRFGYIEYVDFCVENGEIEDVYFKKSEKDLTKAMKVAKN